MWIPKAFELTALKKQQEVVEQYPFATVINTINSHSGIRIDTQHIPLIWHTDQSGNHYLHGHIARANPLWKCSLSSNETVCLFHGPQVYITPNWYPTKKEHGKAVPTWNYVVVHISGTMHFIDDHRWKSNMLSELVEKMENKIEKEQTETWQLSDAPGDYIKKMLASIVGIEIKIKTITAQSKTSQNQPRINQEGIIKGLKQSQQVHSKPMMALIENVL